MVELNLELRLSAGARSNKTEDVEETRNLNAAFALAQDDVAHDTSLDDEVTDLKLILHHFLLIKTHMLLMLVLCASLVSSLARDSYHFFFLN